METAPQHIIKEEMKGRVDYNIYVPIICINLHTEQGILYLKYYEIGISNHFINFRLVICRIEV